MELRDIEGVLDKKLEYRKTLGIPEDVNFGIEVEVNDINYVRLEKRIKKMLDGIYKVKADLSIAETGAEVISPVLNDTKETWNELFKISNAIKTLDHSFFNSSFQVNFDLELLSNDINLLYFIKYFVIYENILYRFSLSNDMFFRTCIDRYAKPLIYRVISFRGMNNNISFLKNSLLNKKSHAISIKDLPDKYPCQILEFRMPNGCDDAILWQNYISCFYYLLNYFKQDYDKEKIDYDFGNITKIESTNEYKAIDLNKAIQFANDIFLNEEDKEYFIKQYIGNPINYGLVRSLIK